MAQYSEKRLVSSFLFVSEAAALLTFALGCTVMAGWILDIAILKSVLPGLITMKANTALCFLLTGLSLWLLQTKRLETKTRVIAQIGASVVIAVSTLSIFEYVSGINLHIDELLFKDTDPAFTTDPGRMAIHAAAAFILTNTALLLIDAKNKRDHSPAQFLALSGWILSAFSLVGYLYGIKFFTLGKTGITPMALPTAAAFFTVCVGIFFARPDKGMTAVIAHHNLSGTIARRLLPITVMVPPALGWLKVRGEETGFLPCELGIAFVVTAVMTVSGVCIFWLIGIINHADTERHEAKQTLGESEDRFRQIFELAPDSYYLTDMKGNFLDGNTACEQLTGYSKEELIGKNFMEAGLLPFHQLPKAAGVLTQALLGKFVGPVELTVIRKDKKRTDIEICVRPVTISSNRMLLGLARDITARKQAEKVSKENKDWLDLALRSARMGVWHWDIVSDKRVFDEQVFCLLGIDPKTFTGTSQEFFQALHPDDRPAVREALNRTLQENIPYAPEYRVIWPDKSIHHIAARGTLMRDESKRPIRLNGIVWDITERKETEEILRKNEKLLRESQRVARVGHYNFDIASDSWTSSEILDEIFGIGPDYPRNVEGWLSIIHPDQREEMKAYLTQHVLTEHQDFDKEYQIIRVSDHTPRWAYGLGQLEFSADGKPARMFGTIQDITDRKRSEEEHLKRSRELEIFYKASIGREEQILKLKQRIKELEGK